MIEKKKLLNFSTSILDFLLLWPKEENYIYNLLRLLKDSVLLLSFGPSWFCGIAAVVYYFTQGHDSIKDLIQFIENITAAGSMSLVMYMILCFINNRRTIMRLVDRLESFKKYGDWKDTLATNDRINFLTKVFLVYGIFGNVCYLIVPRLNMKHCQETRSAKMIRDGTPCGMAVPCKFPFKFDYSPLTEIILMHQIYSCVMVTVGILTLTMLLCGMIIHIVHQLSNLRKLINKMEENQDGEEQLETLKVCIRYHIDIIEYADDMRNAFSAMVLLYFTMTSLVISALCFQIVMEENFIDAVRFSLHLSGWIILLLLVCWYGQILIDESESVADEIYGCPWFLFPIEEQKEVYLIMIRSQRPLTLTAAGLGIMCLPTFLAVLSSAYSFFTVLLEMKPQ